MRDMHPRHLFGIMLVIALILVLYTLMLLVIT